MPDSRDDGGDEALEDATAAQPGSGTALAARPVPAARPRWPLFVGLAGAVLVVDQLTKAWILANVQPGQPIQVVGDTIRLVLSRNTGALFGLFRDNATLFGLVSIAVVVAIVWYHARSPRNAAVSAGLGLLLGGALGNLADRLRLGYVVDFVDAGIGDLRFYTFNVADSAITLALLLLLVVSFRPSPSSSPTSSREAPRD